MPMSFCYLITTGQIIGLWGNNIGKERRTGRVSIFRMEAHAPDEMDGDQDWTFIFWLDIVSCIHIDTFVSFFSGNIKDNIKAMHYWSSVRKIRPWLVVSTYKAL